MIRPFTCVAMLLAGVAGIYLYSSKHRVQLLDRQIETIMHQVHAARDRTAILKAEWTLQNDPMRLKQLADKFLALKPVTPNQFTTLTELDKRLRPPRDPNSKPGPLSSEMADQKPGSSEAPDAATSSLPQSDELKPVDTKPAEAKPSEAKEIEPRPKPSHEAEPPRLQASHDTPAKQQSHFPEHRREVARAAPVTTRSVVTAPALPRPVATAAVVATALPPPPVTSPTVSALGMARTPLAPPVPQAAAIMSRDGN